MLYFAEVLLIVESLFSLKSKKKYKKFKEIRWSKLHKITPSTKIVLCLYLYTYTMLYFHAKKHLI